jgi:hypothetical protein
MLGVRNGTKVAPASLGLTRGFGATVGAATTDSFITPLASHSTLRTFAVWVNANGAGGGAVGRLFDKREGAAAQAEICFYNGSYLHYERTHSTTAIQVRHTNALTNGRWTHFAVTYDSSSTSNVPEIYIDGIHDAGVQTIGPPAGTPVTNTSRYSIGNRVTDSIRNWDGLIGPFAIFNNILSASEIASLYQNTFQIAASPRRIWSTFGASAGGGTSTGTSSATLDAVTGTAAATLAIAATSAASLGATTGTASGAAAIAGASAATLAATTGVAAGTLAIAATSAQTLGAVTGTATGTTLGAATGTSAATLAATTGTAAGTLALAATSAATVGIVTGTSAGTISIGGASAQTLNDVTGVANGNTTGATVGSSVATLASVSGAAAGHVDVLATSVATLAAISGTAAGQISIIGSSSGQGYEVTGPAPAGVLGPRGSRHYALRSEGNARRPSEGNARRPSEGNARRPSAR